MRDLLQALGRVLEVRLFTIGGTVVTVSTLLASLAVLIITVWLGRVLRRLVQGTLTRRGARADVVGSVSGLIYYSVLIAGFAVALSTAGIELAAMFAAGAVFAVGIGFALQSIAQNFVAGVILLTERAIKPGDLLEVEGKLVKVVEIGIRACIARTRDSEDLIIPNSVLIQTTVKNFTLREPSFRVRIPVGVVYASDMTLVRATLTEAARKAATRWSPKGESREPMVLLTEFGAHSVNWEVGIWIDEPWERRVVASDLHEAVWQAFQERGIIIAFPQLDVHLDPAVTSSLTSLAGRAA
jgi:small-conductance mechanosensitive channel